MIRHSFDKDTLPSFSLNWNTFQISLEFDWKLIQPTHIVFFSFPSDFHTHAFNPTLFKVPNALLRHEFSQVILRDGVEFYKRTTYSLSEWIVDTLNFSRLQCPFSVSLFAIDILRFVSFGLGWDKEIHANMWCVRTGLSNCSCLSRLVP